MRGSRATDCVSQSQLRQYALLLVGLAALLVFWAPLLERGYRVWKVSVANERLLSAAAAGDLSGVSEAIAAGAEFGATDSSGRTALGHALQSKNVSLVQLLLDAGMEYDATTVLTFAVREDAFDLARWLLEAGADPNGSESRGKTPLHCCVEQAANEMMELLLEFDADPNRAAPNAGNIFRPADGPPLLAAIASEHPHQVRFQMIRLLLEHGAAPSAEYGGRNAMDLAIDQGDGQLGDLLREYGAAYGPREAVAFNRLGELEAMLRESPSILHDRYRPTWTTAPGEDATLLGIALQKGYREVAAYLVERGAPLHTTEPHGQTLLHLAARGGDPELTQLLVARGLDINAKDDFQDTPLTDVVWKGRTEVVSALIKAGADVNRRTARGWTALHLAVAYDRSEAIQLLLAAGADPTLANDDGDSAMDIARARNPGAVALLEQAHLANTSTPGEPERNQAGSS